MSGANGSPRLRIEGRQKLEGQAVIAGSKNSALPIMAASLSASDQRTSSHLRRLDDAALPAAAQQRRHAGRRSRR